MVRCSAASQDEAVVFLLAIGVLHTESMHNYTVILALGASPRSSRLVFLFFHLYRSGDSKHDKHGHHGSRVIKEKESPRIEHLFTGWSFLQRGGVGFHVIFRITWACFYCDISTQMLEMGQMAARSWSDILRDSLGNGWMCQVLASVLLKVIVLLHCNRWQRLHRRTVGWARPATLYTCWFCVVLGYIGLHMGRGGRWPGLGFTSEHLGFCLGNDYWESWLVGSVLIPLMSGLGCYCCLHPARGIVYAGDGKKRCVPVRREQSKQGNKQWNCDQDRLFSSTMPPLPNTVLESVVMCLCFEIVGIRSELPLSEGSFTKKKSCEMCPFKVEEGNS